MTRARTVGPEAQRSSGGESTRRRIIGAAESLFARKGFAGTSLREITGVAGVNVAAIHYHFGSKEELLRAVLARIVEPVNGERLRLLDQAEAAAAPDAPTVEAILDAFLAPDLRAIHELGPRGAVITRFMGRSYTEPSDLVRTLVQEHFGEVGRRFHGALCRAVPEVSPEEMFWRLMAVVAVITYMLGASEEASGLLDPDDPDAALHRMVAFLSPGVRAPSPG